MRFILTAASIFALNLGTSHGFVRAPLPFAPKPSLLAPHHSALRVGLRAPPGSVVSQKANLWEYVLHDLQLWAILRPSNILAKLILTPISLVEGWVANDPTYLDRKRRVFGSSNFCSAGQVVLGDFEVVVKALTEHQTRTNRLGSTVLNRDHLSVNGHMFLIALSDGSSHAMIRSCIVETVINKAAEERQGDETCKRLLQELAQEYKSALDQSSTIDFFKSTTGGLQRFLVRYMHYVLLQLDPDDHETTTLLTKLYFDTGFALYFFSVASSALKLANINGAKKWPDLIHQVTEIYKQSPVLRDFDGGQKKYDGIMLDDLVQLILPVFGIAGLPGPLSLAIVALGGKPFPNYFETSTSTIDSTVYWDKLDLNNRTQVEHHIYECGRLWMPVSAVHRVATSEFTAAMPLKSHETHLVTFPKGTIVAIPMIFASLERTFWGPTVYEYDASRKNLCPFSMLFNSVGDRSNGRICPGKNIGLNLVVSLLQELGQVRRSHQA